MPLGQLRGVCWALRESLGPLSVLWHSQGPEHIYCSCVSPCGTWVGYSTASRFQLYRVHCDGDSVSLRKVREVGAWGVLGAGMASVTHGECG